jgi:hypothetical protein
MKPKRQLNIIMACPFARPKANTRHRAIHYKSSLRSTPLWAFHYYPSRKISENGAKSVAIDDFKKNYQFQQKMGFSPPKSVILKTGKSYTKNR